MTRKRSSYRPRAVIHDTMSYIKQGQQPIASDTCGQCKHGNFYDKCGKCEDDYERQRKVATTRQKLGEAWAPWMDKKSEPTSKPCELGSLPFNAEITGLSG